MNITINPILIMKKAKFLKMKHLLALVSLIMLVFLGLTQVTKLSADHNSELIESLLLSVAFAYPFFILIISFYVLGYAYFINEILKQLSKVAYIIIEIGNKLLRIFKLPTKDTSFVTDLNPIICDCSFKETLGVMTVGITLSIASLLIPAAVSSLLYLFSESISAKMLFNINNVITSVIVFMVLSCSLAALLEKTFFKSCLICTIYIFPIYVLAQG